MSTDMAITCACLNNSVGVEVASIYEAEQLRAEAVAAGLPVPPFVQRLGLHFVVVHPERAKADMRDLIDAHEINDRICKACGGTGSLICPECPNGCQNCGATSIVTCDVCDAIDFDHATALTMNAETCSAYCDAAGERPCADQIRAAGERVNALLDAQAARLAR